MPTYESLGNTNAQMIEGAVYELSIITRLDSQLGVNVHHYQVRRGIGTPGPLPAQGTAARTLAKKLTPLYQALMTARADVYGVRMRNVDTTLGASEVIIKITDAPGASEGEPLPMQVAGLITRRSERSGPKGRSRTFVPFPPSSRNQFRLGEPRPSIAYLDRLDSLAQTLTGGTPLEEVPTVWSATFGLWSRRDLVFSTYVTVSARPVWATQRKRGNLGKTNPLPF